MKLQNKVKILVVGDIVGKGARNAFINYLPKLKEKYDYDLIAINAENTTHGKGLNYKHYKLYHEHHIDVLTMGNHLLDNVEIYDYIDKIDNIVVPGNVEYNEQIFNKHKKFSIIFENKEIIFLNLLSVSAGQNFLENINEPLSYFDNIYNLNHNAIYIIDYHAEYTLEKNLLAYYVDNRASLVYGTHTHVQTSDERILPNGTGFISDVGMCGAVDSIIGYDYQSYINKFKNGGASEIAKKGPYMINALYAEISLENKKVIKLERINQKL